MICPHCRTENLSQSSACSKCGSSLDLALDLNETLDAGGPSSASSSAHSAAAVKQVTAASSGSASSHTGPRTRTSIFGLLEPGDELGNRYRIEALLGQGGMGRVYRAFDRELERQVALKVLLPEMASNPDAMQRFKQELLLASRISHKNILRIHDLGEADGVKFISMAWVDGPDLHHILQEQKKLPLDRALTIAMQLCEALEAAHGEGVVHRDLKPQNILMGKDDHVFVSDFGLAKSLESSSAGMTRTGQYLGTPRYMSPEQVEAKPTDHRSDLYSLGLIFFEMLTGEDAFKGDSTLQVMYRRVKEKPPNPRGVNPELPEYISKIILRCLEKDPEQRYQGAGEILADLRSREKPKAARATSLVPALGKFWYAVAGVVVVAILLFGVPSIRHRLLGGGATLPGAPPRGVPALSSGRFIAVLPLQVLGAQSQLEYLAQGVEEALSAKLFQLKNVRVTAPDAASKADIKQPLAKIAERLGANLLVQGSLQSAGDQIRITVNLEDVADSKRLWSQEFNGASSDIFKLEDQIYTQLVSALRVSPTQDEIAKAAERPTQNATAYDLYLHGRDTLRGHDIHSIQKALEYFTQAAQQDPSFALAEAGIADASLNMYVRSKDIFWTQKALVAAQQAEKLNDKLPEVHSTLGNVYRATGKYPEAIAELKRALALAPNSDEAYRRLGDVYLASGNWSDAIQSFKKAVQLNPYYWANLNELGNAFFESGDYQQALQAFQQITVLEPDIDVGYENIGNVYLMQGKYQECIPYYQKALQIEPYYSTYSNLGIAYLFLKKYAEAASNFEQAVHLNPNDAAMMMNLGDAYRWGGQQDKARAAYQQAISLGYKQLEVNPKSADTMALMAISYAKIGDAQNAESFIARARAIDRSNVDDIFHQAEIAAILGRKDEALAALRQAFEKNYPAEYAAGDQDLEALQQDPRFAALLKQYSSKKP